MKLLMLFVAAACMVGGGDAFHETYRLLDVDLELRNAVYMMSARFEEAYQKKDLALVRSLLADNVELIVVYTGGIFSYAGNGMQVPLEAFRFDLVKKIKDINSKAIIRDCCEMIGMKEGCRRCVNVVAPSMIWYEDGQVLLKSHQCMIVLTDEGWKVKKAKYFV